MAEGENGGSWWGGWLQKAKETSASALEFVKKDLQDYTCTTVKDTQTAAEKVQSSITHDNAKTATETVKHGFNRVIGVIKDLTVIPPDDDDELTVGSNGEPTHYNSFEARLKAIQLDPSTYCSEPKGPREDYEKWLETFQLDERKPDMSELLVANVEVRSIYTQLVPSAVAHSDFWKRYFYYVHLLKSEERRREDLKKWANKQSEDQGWDDDGGWEDMTESSSPKKDSPVAKLAADSPSSSTSLLTETENKATSKQNVPESGFSDVQLSAVTTSETSNPKTNVDQSNELIISDSATSDGDSVVGKPASDPYQIVYMTDISSAENSPRSAIIEEKTSHSEPEIPELSKPDQPTQPDHPSKSDETDSKSTPSTDIPKSADTPAQSDIEHSHEPTKQETTPDTLSESAGKDTAPEIGDQSVSEPPSQTTSEVFSEGGTRLHTRDSNGIVVVGMSEGATPSSESANSSSKPESSSLDDEWEKDFDIEVTEEDLKLVQEQADKTGGDVGDDWEDWE